MGRRKNRKEKNTKEKRHKNIGEEKKNKNKKTKTLERGRDDNSWQRYANLQGALGGDAHTVGSSFGAGKGPAATAVGLITDIVNDLCAGRPGHGRIKVGRDVFNSRGRHKVNHLACSLGL